MKRVLGELRIIGGDWRSRRIAFDADPAIGLRATPDRVRQTLFDWLSPLITGAECLDLFAGTGARGVLVLIAAARSTFKLSESKNAMNTIRRYAAEDAHVIFGAAYDDSLGDQLRVTVIATGLSGARRAAAPLTVVQSQPQQVLRTGTDNLPILNTTVVSPAQVMPAMESTTVPSVWRTNRTQAAAKVESLVSNGMDELEIPAFLRKQAD